MKVYILRMRAKVFWIEGKPDFLTAFGLAHTSTTVTNSVYRRMDENIERDLKTKNWKV
jgi:hypothetical protein